MRAAIAKEQVNDLLCNGVGLSLGFRSFSNMITQIKEHPGIWRGDEGQRLLYRMAKRVMVEFIDQSQRFGPQEAERIELQELARSTFDVLVAFVPEAEQPSIICSHVVQLFDILEQHPSTQGNEKCLMGSLRDDLGAAVLQYETIVVWSKQSRCPIMDEEFTLVFPAPFSVNFIFKDRRPF